MTVREYDEAMSSAFFMKAQANAMLENATQIESSTKQEAMKYLGEQDASKEALLPLRHRLMMKELGRDIPFDGPSPDIETGE